MTNELKNAMNAIIDFGIKNNCWNLYDSYGEICVGCGCCSKDKLVRAKARFDVILSQIDRCEHFDGWSNDIGLRKLQEENIESDLKYFRKKLQYYRKKIEELERENNS